MKKINVLVTGCFLMLTFQLSAQVTCVDTVNYVEHKSSGDSAYAELSITGDSAAQFGAAQAYYLNSRAKILGVKMKVLLDFDKVNSTTADVNVQLSIYSFQFNDPQLYSIIASQPISLKDVSNSYQEFYFPTPVDVDDHFAIAINVTGNSGKTVYPISNINGDGRMENLSLIYWGNWYTNPTGTGYPDVDYLFKPIMQYTVDPRFTTDAGAGICDYTTVTFNAPQLVVDSMFNKGVLDGKKSYTWKVEGDSSFSINDSSVEYNFTTGDSVTINLYDTIQGWTKTCFDDYSDSVLVYKINLKTVVQDVSCMGNSDGLVSATASNTPGPYEYKWNNSVIMQTIPNRQAGTYTLKVTDQSSGCVLYDTLVVSEPYLTQDATDAKCKGVADGSAAVTAYGGTPGHTYTWSNGDVGQVVTDLTAGTYYVTVKDAAGCKYNVAVKIAEPDSTFEIFITSIVNATCNVADGAATVSAGTGGKLPYTYSWSTGSTTATISGKFAGTYTITVFDNDNCKKVKDALIDQAGAPTIGIVENKSVSCNGDADGTLQVTANGGTLPLNYLWSDGSVGDSIINNLSSGNYIITVVDGSGCKVIDEYFLGEPEILNIYTWSNDVSCNGNAEGAIDISVSGGTLTYTYSWSDGSTTQNVSTLIADIYAVTVMDANNCLEIAWDTIVEPSLPLSLKVISTNMSCKGTSDGSASATTSGGTSGYTYKWNTGVKKQTLSNLSANNYTVTATDANGCKIGAATSVSEPAVLSVFVSGTDAACYGSSDGSASASGSGGTGNLYYSWNNDSVTADISNLLAGNYTISVSDDNGCMAVSNVTINQPGVISITTSVQDASSLGAYDGKATASVSGGTPPYNYSWSNGGNTSTISNLALGFYFITVTDANKCKEIQSATVSFLDGLSEKNNTNQFIVYPNPTKGKFILKISKQNNLQYKNIEIINVLGEKVKQINVSNSIEVPIDISDMPQGIYILQFSKEDQVLSEKIYLVK